MTFVLDNSIAMRWFFESAQHPYADSILQRLAAGELALRRDLPIATLDDDLIRASAAIGVLRVGTTD